MKTTAQDLAMYIAAEIVRQAGEDHVDNLGDGESLLMTGNCPVINVVEAAENILKSIEAREQQP